MGAKDIKEHEFKKGQSGNPTGRKKGSRNRATIVKEILAQIISMPDPLGETDDRGELIGDPKEYTVEELITMAQARKANVGDTNAYKALMDSAYGTPKQTIDQNSTEVQPPKIIFTNKNNQKSDEEE